MAEEKKPCCPKKVELLVQSKHAPFAEADREFLNGCDENHLDMFILMNDTISANSEKETKPTMQDAMHVLQEQIKTPEAFIAILPAGLRETMKAGYDALNRQKAELTEKIVANSDGRLTAEKLQNKTLDELADMASLIKTPVDFSANVSGVAVKTPDDILLPTGIEAK